MTDRAVIPFPLERTRPPRTYADTPAAVVIVGLMLIAIGAAVGYAVAAVAESCRGWGS